MNCWGFSYNARQQRDVDFLCQNWLVETGSGDGLIRDEYKGIAVQSIFLRVNCYSGGRGATSKPGQ